MLKLRIATVITFISMVFNLVGFFSIIDFFIFMHKYQWIFILIQFACIWVFMVDIWSDKTKPNKKKIDNTFMILLLSWIGMCFYLPSKSK